MTKRKKNITSKQIAEKAKRIKFLILDVDGVMTDGRIYLDHEGKETKSFHIHDGHGISLVERAGIQVGIISGRSSKAVEIRARELAIDEVHQGVEDKLKVYEDILARKGLVDEEVAYIGDDLLDTPLLRRVGLAVAVANAHEEIKKCVDWITNKDGGAGAIREVADQLLRAHGKASRRMPS